MPNQTPTQQFIDIAGIKDGLVILKNGSYRLILSVSAINFSLKSEQEQNALIFQYQSFLNSLHFPIQIVIQSKRLDLNQYLKKVEKLKSTQKNELIALQTEDYIDFVSQLINVANIMKKSFFVVVGFDPTSLKKPSMVDKLFKKESPGQLRVSDQEFKHHKEQILQHANVVATGLGSLGLHCVQMTTEEIIELFYKIYNPEIADKERFSDVDSITPAMVQKKTAAEEETQPKNQKEEEVLDNSQLVEERIKQEAQLREREEAKSAERQIKAPANDQPVQTQTRPDTPPAPQTTTVTAPQPTAPDLNQTIAQPQSVPIQTTAPAQTVSPPPTNQLINKQ